MPLYAAGQKIRGSEINALPQVYSTTTDQGLSNSAIAKRLWLTVGSAIARR